ncbi:hypothetical protein [Streptomyces sp. NPDC059224]|uniref:hypothetical protein n=1 Tax=Streptomyces sp. NPDC059224 TaxID=3346775 RepID=UPI0036AEEC52
MHDTGARFLGRLRANRRAPVLSRLTDGSYLSAIGTVPVRVVEARITVTYDDYSFTNSYRLVTTLTDARRYPAPALVALCHQQREHESAYFALRHTTTDGRVLRSGDPVAVEQEMWALLALCQALRTVMAEAAEYRPGTDPDGCGFTTAIQTARDLVVQAADVIKPGALGTRTTGVIGTRVLAGLLPHRRLRISTRKVRSPVSRYTERQDDGRPATSRLVADLDGTILEPDPDLPPVSHDDRHTPAADRRRQRVLDLLHAEPDRQWHTRDLARHLGDITLSTMYRQLDMGRKRTHRQDRPRHLQQPENSLHPLATSGNTLTTRPWVKSRPSACKPIPWPKGSTGSIRPCLRSSRMYCSISPSTKAAWRRRDTRQPIPLPRERPKRPLGSPTESCLIRQIIHFGRRMHSSPPRHNRCAA